MKILRDNNFRNRATAKLTSVLTADSFSGPRPANSRPVATFRQTAEPRRQTAEPFYQAAEPFRQTAGRPGHLAERVARPSNCSTAWQSQSASWRNHSAKPIFPPKAPPFRAVKQLKYNILWQNNTSSPNNRLPTSNGTTSSKAASVPPLPARRRRMRPCWPPTMPHAARQTHRRHPGRQRQQGRPCRFEQRHRRQQDQCAAPGPAHQKKHRLHRRHRPSSSTSSARKIPPT